MYKVYKYTNKINNKVYIGQTKNTLAKRADNGRGYAKCPFFNNAIQKYGLENFDVEILKDSLTLNEANYWEEYYIKKFNSTNRDKGYNLKDGGNNSESLNKKVVICLETKQVYSSLAEVEEKTGIGYCMVSDYCNHVRGYKSAGGYHWSFYNIDIDEYEKQLVKKVLCKEKNTTYKNCADAAKALNLKSNSVARVCSGIRQSLYGLHFEYIYEEVK